MIWITLNGAISCPLPHERLRLLQFIEAGTLDAERFQAILGRYSLTDRWKQFERQFLSDIP